MQDALDTVRADVIADAVSDAMSLVDSVPEDLRVRTLKALREKIAEALSPKLSATSGRIYPATIMPKDEKFARADKQMKGAA